MLYFIPAWYKQNEWCENEQYWYVRRTRTEFDDTVKHIQLFRRSGAHPFKIMLLSFAPNFRHFLHRQSVFHAPYWSCFDAIQEIRKKKVRTFSVHNLYWPQNVEFVYSSFAMTAFLHGERYAQAEFGEDGNLIQIDMYQNEKLHRRNFYDDRGFVSSTIVFDAGVPQHQDYLTDRGVWKIRHFFLDGHVEVNSNSSTYMLEYEGQEYSRNFRKSSYMSLEDVIAEVFREYIALTKNEDLFCVAMHELHTRFVLDSLRDRKNILSFFENRYDVKKHPEVVRFLLMTDYVITDSQETLKKIQKSCNIQLPNIMDITPFDSRVDFGISRQLNVQKIMVPVDGMGEEDFRELIYRLGYYLYDNDNARIYLFTRISDFDRKKNLIQKVRTILDEYDMETEWAREQAEGNAAENRVDSMDAVPVKFFVEQCVSELAVSKCIREQRIVVDMRKSTEVYLRIMGLSVGIPQIVYMRNQFVEDGKNGMIIKDFDRLSEAISFYLEGQNNWNEAMVYSYELGKKYTTAVLVEKWKEVISFVGSDSSITTGN